jgi:hypothetical protein
VKTLQGFEMWERIGIGIPNPRAVVRIPVPKDLTPEQLAELEAWIDKTNAELEAHGAIPQCTLEAEKEEL